ncbi:unnamed protein product, partial [Brassica oleracea]
VGVYILGCALYVLNMGPPVVTFLSFFQATAFFVSGFGYIRT